MSESERIIIDILKDMEDMKPDAIEKLRKRFIDEMKAEDMDRLKRVEEFVNTLCDTAVKRAKKREMAT